MTNRDKLLSEIDRLDGEALFRMLGHVALADRLSDLLCQDCRAMHGGACPSPGDNGCPEVADWLGWPCTHETIITSEVLNP